MTDFSGLDTKACAELRKQLRRRSVGYRVVKNTLVELAAKKADLPDITEWLTGSTAVAYGDDPLTPVKAIRDFVKEADEEKPIIKTGIVDGRLLSDAEVDRLESLPDMPQLQAKLLGTLMAPVAQLVRLLSAAPSDFVRVLEARRIDQNQGNEDDE